MSHAAACSRGQVCLEVGLERPFMFLQRHLLLLNAVLFVLCRTCGDPSLYFESVVAAGPIAERSSERCVGYCQDEAGVQPLLIWRCQGWYRSCDISGPVFLMLLIVVTRRSAIAI